MYYGKNVDGIVIYAPKKIQTEDTIVYNPTDEQLVGLGYKPLIYIDPPEAPEGYHYESSWEEEVMSIIQTWHLEQDSEDISDEEIIAILLGEEGMP